VNKVERIWISEGEAVQDEPGEKETTVHTRVSDAARIGRVGYAYS
jgi:hypothetical protein